MTSNDRADLDARLTEALRSRVGPDGVSAERLLQSIVSTATVTPQERRRLRFGRMPRRFMLVVAVGLLGAAAVGVGLQLERTQPAAATNGPIVLLGGTSGWRAIDPIDGGFATAVGLENVYPDLPLSAEFGQAAWSPDGRDLAYTADTGIFVAHMAGGPPTEIGGSCEGVWACDIAWSPDGTQLIRSDADGVWQIRADGSDTDARLLIPSRDDELVNRASWSPDGRWIVYVRQRPGTTISTLWLIRPDGTDDHPVSLPTAEDSLGIGQPVWTPDSSRIVFLAFSPRAEADPPELLYDIDLVSIDVTATDPSPSAVASVGSCACLGVSPSFAIAPDGTAYAVSTINMVVDGDVVPDGLFVIDAASGAVTRIGDFFNSIVTWQPG